MGAVPVVVRASTRLTVLFDTPSAAAMRAWVNRLWRSSTMASALAGARRAIRPRRRVAQARLTAHQVAAQPLACRRSADPVRGRCLRHAQSTPGNVLNHLDSTNVGESGILMAVHSAEFLESTGGLAIPSLSKLGPGGHQQPIEPSHLVSCRRNTLHSSCMIFGALMTGDDHAYTCRCSDRTNPGTARRA